MLYPSCILLPFYFLFSIYFILMLHLSILKYLFLLLPLLSSDGLTLFLTHTFQFFLHLMVGRPSSFSFSASCLVVMFSLTLGISLIILFYALWTFALLLTLSNLLLYLLFFLIDTTSILFVSLRRGLLASLCLLNFLTLLLVLSKCLLDILDKWKDWLENGGRIDVIYTYLEKYLTNFLI